MLTKQDILNLTGHTDIKKFYSEFPNEDSFKEKYGKKIEKLLRKKGVEKAQVGWQDSYAPDPIEVQSFDYAGNQKQIDKAANKNRRQALRQGVGLNSNEGVADESIQKGGLSDGINKINSENVNNAFTATSTIGSNVQKVSGAIAAKKAEKEKYKLLSELSPLIAQASSTLPEQVKKNYNRPDDPMNMIQPGQLYNPYGEGTNILAAKNGAEIANTFAPNTIYKDLEKAQTGAEMALITEGVNTLGDQASLFFDIGRKKYQKKNDQLISQMGIQPGIQNIQNSYVSHMEDGGMINPQMIKSFNRIPLTKLLAEDPLMQYPNMETFRTGGNIGQNNMAMGGDLRTHWGGGLETVSYNPIGGPTVKAVGNSHDEADEYGRTGIGLSVGDTGNSYLQDYAEFGSKLATDKAAVEVEEEAIIKKPNPDGSESAVVFGKRKFPKFFAKAINKPEWGNKTFNKIVLNNIVSEENKLAKKQSKALQLLESDDLLKKKTGEVTMIGVKDGYEKTLNDKNFLADFQDAINKADEAGFDIKEFEKTGELKQAKMGAKITKAQTGETISPEDYKAAMDLYNQGDIKGFQQLSMRLLPKFVESLGVPTISKRFDDNIKGSRTEKLKDYMTQLSQQSSPDMIGRTNPNMFSNYSSPRFSENFKSNLPEEQYSFTPYLNNEGELKNNFDLLRNIYNEVRPYLLPSNAEDMNLNQIAPELYALSTNQLEPVQAQTYQPQLSTPYDISLQDQLNEITADQRAAQRMMGYNPTAQANLAAQTYGAKSSVLANQFRANQDIKKVYDENRAALNDAQLKNLGIYDTQYQRQEAAKSATKATNLASFKSIADKQIQSNRDEMLTKIYENLYNFRYDSKGRAINMNPLQKFDTEMSSMSSQDIEQLAKQRAAEEKTKAKGSNVARNGSIVRSYK